VIQNTPWLDRATLNRPFVKGKDQSGGRFRNKAGKFVLPNLKSGGRCSHNIQLNSMLAGERTQPRRSWTATDLHPYLGVGLSEWPNGARLATSQEPSGYLLSPVAQGKA